MKKYPQFFHAGEKGASSFLVCDFQAGTIHQGETQMKCFSSMTHDLECNDIFTCWIFHFHLPPWSFVASKDVWSLCRHMTLESHFLSAKSVKYGPHCQCS
jgi:hypothetical protein